MSEREYYITQIRILVLALKDLGEDNCVKFEGFENEEYYTIDLLKEVCDSWEQRLYKIQNNNRIIPT